MPSGNIFVAGDDLVTEVSRWSAEECGLPSAEPQPFCKRGSFLDHVDEFDAAFFGIAPLEATYMDPQQRILLEVAWHALEDAGYAGESVHETQCGIYVGCGISNYEQLFGEDAPAQAWWGNASAVAPARIAYHLHLQGPAIAVDTACSSSLVAMHLACQGLWSGETEMALAGGVYVEATPGFHQVANRAGMLSAQGSCRSFDAAADGFVPGEGVGVTVLKRLSEAVRDGDFIHGTIVASGINQNGRSNGLVAPNGRAQERLVRSIYERFGVKPESIQMLEAHGTGTLMGDSIEFNAMRRVFETGTDQQHFCAVGSVKSNVGHGATAAGVTSVLKALLALKHAELPPSLHFECPNPLIDVQTGPFYVNTHRQPWKSQQQARRRAAVSSFGFSGTNAHVVLEEAPERASGALEPFGSLVVLSARSWEQLREHAANLFDRLRHDEGGADLPLNDVAYTLLVGRAHHSHRFATVARSHAHLTEVLGEYVRTGSSLEVVTAAERTGATNERAAMRRFGNYAIQECRRANDSAQYIEHLQAIADLFVQGYGLDYKDLFPKGSRRVPLPVYPFARKRYWVEARPLSSLASRAPNASTLPIIVPAQAMSPSRSSQEACSVEGDADLGSRLIDALSSMAADLIQVEKAHIDAGSVLLDLGFDSRSLSSFAERINQCFGLSLTPIIFFDYFCLADLASYLTREFTSQLLSVLERPNGTLTRSAALPPPSTFHVSEATLTATPPEQVTLRTANRATSRFTDMPIAIVGMSGVMPQSSDLNSFWSHLQAGDDLISEIPADRWSWEEFHGDPLREANKSSSKWGGFLNEIDKFDRSFFSISQKEAEMMDPQQRIFLELVWKAIEDSGHRVSELSGTRTGVFVGVASNEYIDVLSDSGTELDAYTISGNSHSVLAQPRVVSAEPPRT